MEYNIGKQLEELLRLAESCEDDYACLINFDKTKVGSLERYKLVVEMIIERINKLLTNN